MKTLSAFLAQMADTFETAHAAGRDLSFPPDLVALFGPAFRDAMDAAATLERRARLADELEAYAREFDPYKAVNGAADFVDHTLDQRDDAATIVPFPGPKGVQ